MGTPSANRSRARTRGGPPRSIAANETLDAKRWRPPSVGVHDAAARRAKLQQRQHENDREEDHADGRRVAQVERLEPLLIQEDRDDLGAWHWLGGHHLVEEVERLKRADRF